MNDTTHNLIFLPFGWHQSVAKTLNIHRNTVRNILKKGESHKKYPELMAEVRKLKNQN